MNNIYRGRRPALLLMCGLIGVAFVAAGHYATERFGVQRLTERLDALEGLEARFVDVPNPA